MPRLVLWMLSFSKLPIFSVYYFHRYMYINNMNVVTSYMIFYLHVLYVLLAVTKISRKGIASLIWNIILDENNESIPFPCHHNSVTLRLQRKMLHKDNLFFRVGQLGINGLRGEEDTNAAPANYRVRGRRQRRRQRAAFWQRARGEATAYAPHRL